MKYLLIGMISAILGGLVFVAAVAIIRDNVSNRRYDDLILKHRDELNGYLTHIQNHDIRPTDEGSGKYPLNQLLAAVGAKCLTRHDELFIITFPFMPTDPIPCLVYSKYGGASIISYLARENRCEYVHMYLIRDGWYHVEYDL